MRDELDFSGKSVLVVGGSSGIGNGIARAFFAHGANVEVWGTRSAAEDYTESPGSDLTGLRYSQVCVTDVAAVAKQRDLIPKLDVLVLSQGTVLYRRAEFEPAGFQKVIDVNLNSLMTCSWAFVDKLRVAKGSVIIIGSSAAFHSTIANPAYSASKCGALGLTRVLADAWAKDGVRVNSIAPGYVETKLTTVTTNNPERLKAAIESIPLGRFGTPQDIGSVALFLASHLSSYITGQTLLVDGGMSFH